MNVRRVGLLAGFGLLIAQAAADPARAAMPKVPDGFKIRLVAAVPAVQYPCQVATAPDGSLFVGEDPMDQIGPANKPIDRILLFRDGKEPVVFADKLNAIFGMVWYDGALYVMNMPHLTVFRDRDGDGKADERKELFTNLGVPAGSPNDFNDHIVSGLKIGLDGYLYISVGDKGVPKATGPDGRTAQVVGGGTLRCRLDGTGLEVFSTGTRNHLEPNLDDRDNLFTYDNTDDGLGWWTRVTHHIDGGYYGYPFDYHKRTDRMLPRMAEYGGGSPCGGVFYGEDVWPEKYRGRLFWAEWGKRAVQSLPVRPRRRDVQGRRQDRLRRAGRCRELPPARPGAVPRRPHPLRRRLVDGRLEQQDREAGPGLRGDLREGADAVKTRPRGKDSDSIEAQIKQLDHPSYNERRRAQTALIGRGKAALGSGQRRPGEARDRPGRQAAPGLGAGRDRRRHARGQRSLDRRPEIAGRRRPRPGRPRPGRAHRADRVRAPGQAAQGPRALGPAPGGHRAGADRPERRRSPRSCRSSPMATASSLIPPAKPCGASTTGRGRPRGWIRPIPGSAPGLCSPWSKSMTTRPSWPWIGSR